MAQTLAGVPPVSRETPRSVFPTLNRRTRGWLRFLWDKTTTDDDWSSAGVPHQWWDRYSVPVVLSYGRFDLSFSSYALLLMADQTPAWREVYTQIADGLASRYPTYWGAIDWLTQISDDPKRENYPPRVMGGIPERLRGNYNRFGWTANGVEPWGLQPDPIGADGYLFFCGWFTLLLSTYKYVSGDDKYTRPFKVTGYGDQMFEWDHHRIAEHMARQYQAHPEGPQCENTKIWFYCNSAGGLGIYLYDRGSANRHTAPSRTFWNMPARTIWASRATASWSGSPTTTTRSSSTRRTVVPRAAPRPRSWCCRRTASWRRPSTRPRPTPWAGEIRRCRFARTRPVCSWPARWATTRQSPGYAPRPNGSMTLAFSASTTRSSAGFSG